VSVLVQASTPLASGVGDHAGVEKDLPTLLIKLPPV
jgi:hypothetical protein